MAGPGSKAEAKDLLQSDDRTISMPVGDGLPVIVLRESVDVFILRDAYADCLRTCSFNASQGQTKEQLWDALADFGSALVENKVGEQHQS